MQDPGRQTTGSRADLTATLEVLAARIAAIEDHLGLTAAAVPALPSDPPEVPVQAFRSQPGFQLPAVGISFLMLAGAFLLRAITDAGMLSAPIGVALGLAYVLALLFLTDRDGRHDRRVRANLVGAATVLVAYPFIWETTTKLGLLPARGAAAVTVLVTTLALGVALRHRLKALAWIVLLAAVAVCGGLYWATDATELFLAILVALGVATVWLGYLRDWQGPQWLVAAVVNFLVFVTVMLAAHPAQQAAGRPHPSPEGALPVALALPLVYLTSFAWRTLIRRREAGLFEILQSLGCIMAGYVGAIHLLHIEGRSTAALGWATLLFAVIGYVVAFMLVRQRQGRGLNFFYHAWLGLVLTFIGTSLVVSGSWLPYLWAGLGVAAAITGGIFDRWTLRLHCAVYLIGAAAVTGTAARLFAVFVARRTPSWDEFTSAGLIVAILATVAYGLLVGAQRGREVSNWRRVPRFLVAMLVLSGAGIEVVTALAVWGTSALPWPEGAVVAVTRTAVLSAVTVLLAALGRRPAVAELAWFVNPLLVLIGLKVLLEDLRAGTPISLFFGFTCFGIALIVAPRLRRRRTEATPEPGPESAVDLPGATSEGLHGTDTP